MFNHGLDDNGELITDDGITGTGSLAPPVHFPDSMFPFGFVADGFGDEHFCLLAGGIRINDGADEGVSDNLVFYHTESFIWSSSA